MRRIEFWFRDCAKGQCVDGGGWGEGAGNRDSTGDCIVGGDGKALSCMGAGAAAGAGIDAGCGAANFAAVLVLAPGVAAVLGFGFLTGLGGCAATRVTATGFGVKTFGENTLSWCTATGTVCGTKPFSAMFTDCAVSGTAREHGVRQV